MENRSGEESPLDGIMSNFAFGLGLTIILHSLAPYERRVIELLRNSKDKRARKLAKKRVRRTEPPIPKPSTIYILTHIAARYFRPC